MSEDYEEDEEEEEDEPCTSYCSSDDASPDDSSPLPRIDDTFRARLRRIESWRDMMLASTLPEGQP